MDKHLREDEVLEYRATVVESVGGTLLEAYLGIGALNVRILDDIAAHNGGNTVNDVVLGFQSER